jgi:hypothetical protein
MKKRKLVFFLISKKISEQVLSSQINVFSNNGWSHQWQRMRLVKVRDIIFHFLGKTNKKRDCGAKTY